MKKTFINLICIVLSVFSLSLFSKASAEDPEWKYVGKTDRNKFSLYLDTKSIKELPNYLIRCRVKKELSPEGEKKYRTWFEKSVKKAEKEAKNKVEDKEDLFNLLVKTETREFIYDINCQDKQYQIASGGSLFLVFGVDKGSAEETLLNIVCSSKSN